MTPGDGLATLAAISGGAALIIAGHETVGHSMLGMAVVAFAVRAGSVVWAWAIAAGIGK